MHGACSNYTITSSPETKRTHTQPTKKGLNCPFFHLYSLNRVICA
nr:MAG TPA: hypothetical protein [Caudoviricetes sp.]